MDRMDALLAYLESREIKSAPTEGRSHKFYLYRIIGERYSLLTECFGLDPSFNVDAYGTVEDVGNGVVVELWSNAGKRVSEAVKSYENDGVTVLQRKMAKTEGILKNGSVALK